MCLLGHWCRIMSNLTGSHLSEEVQEYLAWTSEEEKTFLILNA